MTRRVANVLMRGARKAAWDLIYWVSRCHIYHHHKVTSICPRPGGRKGESSSIGDP
jgi:hypothetical protein